MARSCHTANRPTFSTRSSHFAFIKRYPNSLGGWSLPDFLFSEHLIGLLALIAVLFGVVHALFLDEMDSVEPPQLSQVAPSLRAVSGRLSPERSALVLVVVLQRNRSQEAPSSPSF